METLKEIGVVIAQFFMGILRSITHLMGRHPVYSAVTILVLIFFFMLRYAWFQDRVIQTVAVAGIGITIYGAYRALKRIFR